MNRDDVRMLGLVPRNDKVVKSGVVDWIGLFSSLVSKKSG